MLVGQESFFILPTEYSMNTLYRILRIIRFSKENPAIERSSMKLRRFVPFLMAACLFSGCGKDSPAVTPTPEPTAVPTPAFSWSVQLDESQRYQTIDGFGAGFTWYAEEASTHLKKEEIYDLLFKDAGLTILRFKNEYGYKNFEKSAATNLAYYEAAQKRAAERGENVQVLYTSWSPTADLKTNNSINGGGTIRKDEEGNYDYEGFARWWTDGIKAYRERGIPVDLVSVQNECDFTASYDGCEFGMRETADKASYSKAFLASYHMFREEFGDNTPLMVAPETMTCNPTTVKSYLDEVLRTEPESVYAVGHHLYLGGDSSDKPDFCKYDSFRTNLKGMAQFTAERGYHAWQTEFYRGTALQTANMINNSLTYENLNAYIYWGGVWQNTPVDTLETNNLISCSRAITSWPNKQGYLVTGAYYAMRHFSEYIRPGYVRIEAALSHAAEEAGADVRISAYISPDGKRLVAVIINNSSAGQSVLFNPAGFSGNSLIRQTDFSDGYTEDMLYRDLGSLPSHRVLALPASSVTTVVLDR